MPSSRATFAFQVVTSNRLNLAVTIMSVNLVQDLPIRDSLVRELELDVEGLLEVGERATIVSPRK
jgi:hypothetical protein